jgi:Ca2+-binding RTX toxin-like protein
MCGRYARYGSYLTHPPLYPRSNTQKEGGWMMRRTMLLLATMTLTLLVASGVALAVTKLGTDSRDRLRGTNGADTLIGKGDNDILLALAGDDTLLGGPGKDFLLGGSIQEASGGNKTLEGGDGNDALFGGLSSDTMVGGDGNDFLNGGEFDQTPAAKDTISAGDGNDVLDIINKPAGKDVVSCGGGFDRVLADRADLVAPNCERVFVGVRKIDAYFASIPASFFEDLPPFPGG